MKKKLKLNKKTIADLSEAEGVVGGAAITGKVCVITLPTQVCDTKKDCYPSAIECCYTCAVGCLSNDFACLTKDTACV